MFNNGVRIITLISIPRSPPTPGREERGDVHVCVCVCEGWEEEEVTVHGAVQGLYVLSLG